MMQQDELDSEMPAVDSLTEETDRLISSDEVEGTVVYNRQGERLGTIHNFMIDKRSGTVEYAILSFGGFLGIGDNYYPLPWKSLTYEVDQGGYVVDLDKERLQGAPRYERNDDPNWVDPDYGRRVFGRFSGI